ncbi:beta galactofuranosyl glycosyltransferase [Trypanosoma grayi]|uniref:beta galactofuranosyl glycosyltransferase n=1 Tax=Trypanosoma grayi TaxID=71804 RepID=UPI0004F4BD1C|nr:beta galactofuranosyl glycosyltransferase [Trypanosoma grayi]KEG11420.1 beta galactofuranosyl glycosyltransferase [Trypanosoma grayi]
MGSIHRKRLAYVAVFVLIALVLCFQLPVLDSEPPNSGRQPLENYIRCVGERLLVDAESRQLGSNSGPGVLPMVVIPLMLDLHDFQDVMCNISVPIRLLVLVQNGREPQLSSFLDELEAAYGWSRRLVVRRRPENIGYSGAVNFGLRLAMSLPREKMPFVFVTNSDVTFSPDLLPRLLQDAHVMTLHDAARMDELAAEVADESSGHAPASRRIKVLRSSSNISALSTSVLLPDRIRYAPAKERVKTFSRHFGYFCMDYRQSCFTSVILTRLAVSTVGYFDENFYPAYAEDVDYAMRLRMLGFQQHVVSHGTFVHRSNLNLRKSFGAATDAVWFRRVYRTRLTRVYAVQKWGREEVCCDGFKEPFNGTLPLDVWVRDDIRIARARAYGHSILTELPNATYDISLLRQARASVVL